MHPLPKGLDMTSINPRLAAAFAVAAGAVWAAVGILQVTQRDQLDNETVVEGAVGHLALGGLSLGLLLLVPAMFALARYANRPTGAQVAAVGMVGLAILATISNVRGDDPSFFPPVAMLTNLMWFGGMIALAVSLKRAGRISPRIAVLLPLTWIAALPLSSVGGPLLTGAYWLTVGYLMYHGALERRAAQPVAA
jgi:hypothetical protein